MKHFLLILLSLGLFSAPAKTSAFADDDVPITSLITHVLVSIQQSPRLILDVDARFHLPFGNYVECKEASRPQYFKLNNPIDPSKETAPYFAGHPCSTVEHCKYTLSEIEEPNGFVRASFWAWRLPDEGTGPYEHTGTMALWPVKTGAKNKGCPILHLTIQYIPGGGYSLTPTFLTLKKVKHLVRPSSTP